MQSHVAYLDGGPKTHYLYGGDPSFPTLLLIHGFGARAVLYREIGEMLSRRFFVLIPDLPGHGETEPWGIAGLETYSAFLRLLLNSAKRSSVSVVGHSMGGLIGAYFASQNPLLVKRLVLSCPSGIPLGRSRIGWLGAALKKLARGASADLPVTMGFFSSVLVSWCRDFSWMHGTLKMITDSDARPVIATCNGKCRVVLAGKDDFYPLSVYQTVVEGLAGPQSVVILPDALHDWPQMQPELAVQVITKMLGQGNPL